MIKTKPSDITVNVATSDNYMERFPKNRGYVNGFSRDCLAVSELGYEFF